jgi:high-affinity K+ transport system ATPase subunit B
VCCVSTDALIICGLSTAEAIATQSDILLRHWVAETNKVTRIFSLGSLPDSTADLTSILCAWQVKSLTLRSSNDVAVADFMRFRQPSRLVAPTAASCTTIVRSLVHAVQALFASLPAHMTDGLPELSQEVAMELANQVALSLRDAHSSGQLANKQVNSKPCRHSRRTCACV